MAILEFLDAVQRQVRQRADSLVLEQEARRLPESPLSLPSRYSIPCSDVLNRRRSPFSIVSAQRQYEHYSGRPYAAIRVISHRISAQPIYLARRVVDEQRSLQRMIERGLFSKRSLPQWISRWLDLTKYELIEQHPLLDVLASPNEWMIQQQLIDFTITNLLVTGRAFWVIAQSTRTGVPWDIVPIPTTWIQPVHDPQPFSSWLVRPPTVSDKEGIKVDKRYVLHFYIPDPSNPYGAISPLNMLSRAVLNDEAIAEAQHSTFRNEGMPSVALIAGEEADLVAGGSGGGAVALTPEQRQEIVDWFRREYAGVAKYGLPLVLDAIIKDVKILSRNPKEMAFLESSGVTKEQIFEGYGVPAVAAGQVENVTRESASVADRHLCQNTINPIIRTVSQTIQRGLVPLFSVRGERLVLWIEEAWPVDQALELEKWNFATGYFAPTINEVRRFLGLEPLPGGDVVVVPQRARLVDLNGEEPREVLPAGTPTQQPAESEPAPDESDKLVIAKL